MQKLFVIVILVAFVLALPAFAADNNGRFSTPQEFYANSRDVITPGEGALRAESARQGGVHAMGGGFGPVALPGDQMIGVVVLSQRVYRLEQQLQANFVVWEQQPGPIFIYSRLFKPGYSGYYGGEGSSVSYFFARSSLGPGFFPLGVQAREVVNLLDERVSNNSLDGEYVLDVAVVDANTNRLLQQAFSRFYVNQISTVPLLTIRRASWSLNGIDLVGNFPRGQAVLAYVGTAVPGNVNMFAVVVSSDGNTLHLPFFFSSRWEMPLDVVFWVPGFRESGYLPQGLIVPAQPDNARG